MSSETRLLLRAIGDMLLATLAMTPLAIPLGIGLAAWIGQW